MNKNIFIFLSGYVFGVFSSLIGFLISGLSVSEIEMLIILFAVICLAMLIIFVKGQEGEQ